MATKKTEKPIKAYKPIQDAFKNTNESMKNWYKSSGFPRTEETANTICNRGDSITDASTIAYLCSCLDMPKATIVAILEDYSIEVPDKKAEVTTLIRLMSPIVSDEEFELLSQIRKLPKDKQKLLSEMVRSLL